MKRIPLRTLDDQASPLGEVRSADVIREIVRQPMDRTQGASLDEIRRGIRIFDALDGANGSLELEDADWQHLRDKVQAFPWGMVDRRLLTIADDILEA